MIKEACVYTGVRIRWSTKGSMRSRAYFHLPDLVDGGVPITAGDYICLSITFTGTMWQGKGVLINSPES